MSGTYTAEVGPENAAWLASPASSSEGITDNGDGSVSFDADTLSALRSLPGNYDGCVDADDVLWIEGDGFPIREAGGE